MGNQKVLDEITGKIKEVFDRSPARDLEKNLRAMLQSGFSRLDLVTREEFEAVRAMAAKAREEQEVMAERIAALEAKLGMTQPPEE